MAVRHSMEFVGSCRDSQCQASSLLQILEAPCNDSGKSNDHDIGMLQYGQQYTRLLQHYKTTRNVALWSRKQQMDKDFLDLHFVRYIWSANRTIVLMVECTDVTRLCFSVK